MKNMAFSKEKKMISGEEKNDWMTPIPKQSVSRMVLESIKQAMIRRELQPGDFIPSENELVSKMNVGKSSAREAIKMLEAMGVVELVKGQGFRIKEKMDSDVLQPLVFQMILHKSTDDDLLELREMFESSATQLAAQNATEEDFVLLEQSIAKMERDYKRGIYTPDNDIEFHNLVFKSTHNPYIYMIGTTIMELFRESLVLVNITQRENILRLHRDTVDAMRKRDSEAISSVVDRTVASWNENGLKKK